MISHRLLSCVGCVRSLAIAALVILGIMCSASQPFTAPKASDQSGQTPPAPLGVGFTLEGPFTHANLTVAALFHRLARKLLSSYALEGYWRETPRRR